MEAEDPLASRDKAIGAAVEVASIAQIVSIDELTVMDSFGASDLPAVSRSSGGRLDPHVRVADSVAIAGEDAARTSQHRASHSDQERPQKWPDCA